MEASETTETVV